MAMDGLRGYLQLASGLAETSKAKATEAASALLALSSGLSGGRAGTNVQVQVQELAEELMAAAAANRRSLLALIRAEVERAVARTPIPPDEMDRARAAVAKLSADVDELRAQVLANPAIGEVAARLGLAGRSATRPAEPFAGDEGAGIGGTRADSVGEGVVVDAAFTGPVEDSVPAPPRRRPPRKQIADRAATTTAAKTGTAKKSTAKKSTAKTTTARKTTARKTTARKTAAKGTPATTTAVTTKSAAKKTGAKKAAKKAGAKKAGATKRASKQTSTSAAASSGGGV
jgi:hypothetical protein